MVVIIQSTGWLFHGKIIKISFATNLMNNVGPMEFIFTRLYLKMSFPTHLFIEKEKVTKKTIIIEITSISSKLRSGFEYIVLLNHFIIYLLKN